jgi:hypothetical protein
MAIRFALALLGTCLSVSFLTPVAVFGQATAGRALAGSKWAGHGISGDPRVKLDHVLYFDSGSLIIESTCSDNVVESTVKAEIPVIYLDDTTAKLTTGLVSKIPTGQGTCSVNFPASLEFHIDADQMSVGYNGSYQLTHMKRLN